MLTPASCWPGSGGTRRREKKKAQSGIRDVIDVGC